MLGKDGLTYSGPILSTTYIEIPSLRRSMRKTLMTQILVSKSSVPYPHGISISSGACSSYHALHKDSFCSKSLMNVFNLPSRVWRYSRSFQLASDSHKIDFLVLAGSRLVLPLNRKLNSPMSIFFWLIRMRVVRWNEYISLCFSKSPRQP
jgi:hypothetical protein